MRSIRITLDPPNNLFALRSRKRDEKMEVFINVFDIKHDGHSYYTYDDMSIEIFEKEENNHE